MTSEMKTKVERFCAKRKKQWARPEISQQKILYFLDMYYAKDQEVLVAARLQACLATNDIDHTLIDELFGKRVGNLMREMSAIHVVDKRDKPSLLRTKRISGASKVAKDILLACSIQDLEFSLSTRGASRSQDKVTDLKDLLVVMEGASNGLVDLAEQMIELESW